jgi:tetratricopeptide (TPR) repeat protein
MVRAAQAAIQLEHIDAAKDRLRAAIGRSDAHLPALVLLTDLALLGGDLPTAADAAEQLQRVQREPNGRRDAGLTAAAIAARDLGDRARAVRVLRAVLEADPEARLAFERLRVLLAEGEEWAALAEVLAARLLIETDGQRLVGLHVELGGLYRDRLGDPARARRELSTALSQDATSPQALLMLAELDEAEGRFAEAAELLLRRAKVERSRPELARLLYRLGVIYGRHLGDAKRAIACLARVLQVDGSHKEAMGLLADCYAKEWDWKGALQALQRLVSLEALPQRRVEILHRAAQIQEEGLKEPRLALTLFRAALEVDPLYLPAVEALARFFDRQSDVQSLRVLCDTTARRVRATLFDGKRDLDGYRALYTLFTLRRAPDRAAIAAGVLEWAGAAEGDEKRALDRLKTREQYPGAALADPSVDELLFDARVPAGVRSLMRGADEPLRKSFRADVKQLGVQRGDRLGKSGHAVRDLANRIAADLGLREFELYIAPALGRQAVLELTDPLSLCLGAELVEGAHELQLRFLVARFFKMAQLGLASLLRLPADGGAALVGGVVQALVPEFRPTGLDPAQVAAEAARAHKALPRKLLAELQPYALECTAPGVDLGALAAGVAAAGDRAGLLACGFPGPALTMLERMGMPEAARALARFAVGEELPELRRLGGTSIG